MFGGFFELVKRFFGLDSGKTEQNSDVSETTKVIDPTVKGLLDQVREQAKIIEELKKEKEGNK